MQELEQVPSEEKRFVTKGEVEELIREKFESLLLEHIRQNELRLRELSLIERVVRVEEELKYLREEIKELRVDMDKLREDMDKRFNFMLRHMAFGFTLLSLLITFFGIFK